MDRRERWGVPEEALRMAMSAFAAQMWTALPGIVVSFDPSTCTAVIQPAIGGVQVGADGAASPTVLPVLSDVPVVFPRGGGCSLTFPVKEGDEALIIFSCRPIDAWFQSGGVQRPASARMHDLSDAFALVGATSAPNVPSGISNSAVQLRSDDGSAVIELNPTTHAVSITAPGGVTVNAATASIFATGGVVVQAASISLKNAGTALKKLVNEAFITFFNSHVHGNGGGGANTTAPTVPAGSSTTTSVVQAE